MQSGWSALMAAVWNGHEEIAFKLIDAGATPNIQDKVFCRGWGQYQLWEVSTHCSLTCCSMRLPSISRVY